MSEHETELRETIDRMAISGVLNRYALGVDTRDFDAVESCFSADAIADFSGVELGPGGDKIAGWLKGTLTGPLGTMHALSSIRIDLDGDQADSHSYMLVYSIIGEGPDQKVRIRGLQYRDHFRRDPDGWHITRRKHSAEWEAAAPARPLTPMPPAPV